MAYRTAVFCKSFEEDFPRLVKLFATHAKFCADMPFILSIPRADHAALKKIISLDPQILLIFDEDYADFKSVGSYGWFQQQVCKLSIHHTGLADAYLSVDSDAYFVASLSLSDFFHENRMRVVYSRLFTKYEPGNDALLKYLLDSGSRELEPLPSGSVNGFESRLEKFFQWIEQTGDRQPIERARWINHLFEVPSDASFQPGQVLHAPLLAAMEAFFANHNLSLANLVKLIPWEYNWYGGWTAAAEPTRICPSVSPIIHFASEQAVAHAKAFGITAERLSQRFKVVQMAARHFDATTF